MPDLLLAVNDLLREPPTGLLGLSPGPGLISGFVDLPILLPGTVNPSYGLTWNVTSFPPAAGRSFTEIQTFQYPYCLVTAFGRTFDGFDLPLERVRIVDAQVELRWFGPGLSRITLEFRPGWEVGASYLIILG